MALIQILRCVTNYIAGLVPAVPVPGGSEGHVDGGEEEVRHGQADHKGGGGVGPQLSTSQQGHHGHQVA